MSNLMARLFQFAAVISAVVVGLGACGRWHYLLDLASHFRFQVTFAMMSSALVLWILGRGRTALIASLGGLLLLGSMASYVGPSPRAPSVPADYRIMTVNVWTNNDRHQRVIHQVLSRDPDLIVFQETDQSWIESLESALSAKWRHRKVVPRSDNFGIALFSKVPWRECEVVTYSRFDLPAIIARFDHSDGRDVQLIAAHPLPPVNRRYWQDRNSTFELIGQQIQASEPQRSIVVGDLNCTPWSPCFQRLLDESELRDSAPGWGLPATWFPLPFAICGLPIDHVLVGSQIEVTGRTVGPDVGSDHRPLIVDVRLRVRAGRR